MIAGELRWGTDNMEGDDMILSVFDVSYVGDGDLMLYVASEVMLFVLRYL